ncbi:MAG: ATP synthase subunit I [Lachnospiraceae bacterium]|nr:ATP synthase subunit I [Lachnospiraceae bacterium]
MIKKKLKSMNETLLDLIIGIIIYGVLVGVLGMITSKGNPFFLLGVVAGTIVAIGLMFHMLYSIDGVLDMDPKTANTYMMKRAFLRFLIMAVTAVIAIKIHFLCFLGVILALMGIKISALMQRFINRYITKKII